MKKTALIIISVFALTHASLSQDFWQPTGFNNGGQVYSLVVSTSGAVIAGKNDKIFRSTNTGTSWSQITTLPNDIQCFGKKNQNGYLFAGLNYGGIYKSTNDGMTWGVSGLTGKNVNNIVVAPNGNIFVACSCTNPNCGGVYQSTDNGNTWGEVLSALYDVYGLAVDDAGNIYAGTCDTGSSGWGEILKLNNNGSTWISIGWYQNWGIVRGITVNHNGVIICVLSGGQVYRSTNGGTSWTQVLSGLNYYNTFPILTNSINTTYIASNGQGVYQTLDEGITWSQVNSGLTTLSIVSLAFDLSQYLYAGSMNSSIFRTTSSTCAPPVLSGSISGVTNPCVGSSQTYSITPVPGATSYQWSLPPGWTGSSTTSSISTVVGSGNGTITVTASNSCGTSLPVTLAVTVTTVPPQPGAITGNNNPCVGSSQSYSITPVPGATSYQWSLPPGWTGSSTTSSISTVVGSGNGTITVTASNSCGTSLPVTLAVTVTTVPPQPGAITGNNNPCVGSSQSYSITPVPGATSYQWSLPPGWTGSSASSSISTVVGSGNGTITVTASNSCGTSLPVALTITVMTVPPQPGAITGNSNPCKGTSQTYSIEPVIGATSYAWSLPQGWTGSSNTFSITTIVGSESGSLSVYAINECGNSEPRVLGVIVISIPTQPGSISGNLTPQPGSSEVYSVDPVSGATTYSWTLPPFWTGLSTSNTITTTVGSVNGEITVSAQNSCGTSTPSQLSVIVTDIRNALPGDLKLFPSPNNGIFYIESQFLSQGNVMVEVVDSKGCSVYKQDFTEIRLGRKIEINLQPIQAGVYYVILITKSLNLSGKVIIQ